MKQTPFVVATPLDMAFDYAISDDNHIKGGDIAMVPFGKRYLLAVHFPDMANMKKNIDPNKLKSPIGFFHQPPFSYQRLSANHLKFLSQLSQYYGGRLGAPLGGVVKMALPIPKIFSKKFLEKISHHTAPTATALPESQHKKKFALNDFQLTAINHIKKNFISQQFSTHLLHGITGSGKTAVYFEMMREVLMQGKKVLVLLPEISLSTQWREKFYDYFGNDIKLFEWHSHLSNKQREENFYHIMKNDVSVLVGARSALLLPLEPLGLVVVDEEHDPSYKQQSGVRYHARDMAILRAKIFSCPIILSSATPSLESYHNATIKKYHLTHISDRVLAKKLPTINIIDLKQHPLAKDEFISTPLKTAMEAALLKGEQALLFINRRGFAPITLCTACGKKLACHQCSSYLTHHSAKKKYQCHQCDWFISEQQLKNADGAIACPDCKKPDSLIAFGPGAERVMAEVQQKFPTARTALATSDSIKKEADLKKLISDIETKKIDIVVGTQILAKGHDFPYLSLVGVIATDQLFLGEDPRAMEKAWQGLAQVIGRAGRHQTTSSAFAILQTYQPNEETLSLLVAGKEEEFLQKLLTIRFDNRLPPFARLSLLTLLHKNEEVLKNILRAMKQQAITLLPAQPATFKIYGPAPSPMAKIRGLYRYRFLIIAHRHQTLIDFFKIWLKLCHDNIPDYKKIHKELDIDPQDFM
ncbi:MAG: replication restart helicase PriA [Alphaproteobacteria bacterium]